MRKRIIYYSSIYTLFDYKAIGVRYTALQTFFRAVYTTLYGKEQHPSDLLICDFLDKDIYTIREILAKRHPYLVSEKTLAKAEAVLAEYGMHFKATKKEMKEWAND